MYVIRKLSVEEGKSSRISAGFEGAYATLNVFKHSEKVPPKPVKIKDIEEGYQILLETGLGNWMNTSPIKEIVSKENNKIVFKTQTSTYELKYLK